MTGPREILTRARANRRCAPRPTPAPLPPQPAPAPMQPRQTSPAPPANPFAPALPQRETAPPPPARRDAPPPAGGHALYSALMRSHDRVNTRHLDDRG